MLLTGVVGWWIGRSDSESFNEVDVGFLADAFAADAVDLGEFFQGLRLVGQAPFCENVLLAVVEAFHRALEELMADTPLLVLGDDFVL